MAKGKKGTSSKKGATATSSSKNNINNDELISSPVFRGLLLLVAIGLLVQFSLMIVPMDKGHPLQQVQVQHEKILRTKAMVPNAEIIIKADNNNNEKPAHFFPALKPLPALAVIEQNTDNAELLVKQTLDGTKPTITGIAIILQRFLLAQHDKYQELAAIGKSMTRDDVIPAFLNLVEQHLVPLDEPYRGRNVFPVRQDNSIYISVAAFRDYLLGETLKDAFRKSKFPHRLYIGAIVQNCFGVAYTCKTGVEVVGKDAEGKPITKVSDAPPDANGIEEFCSDEEFVKYCQNGQIRVLYVNETEAAGPAVARYMASKLWGGETYYVQVDAHLQFAQDWDERYIQEIQTAASYPKVILSAYPPGFGVGNLGESVGTRLCSCVFSPNDVEHDIIRINTGQRYKGGEAAPSQIAFMAAGFFMARAEFLKDVPFDPMLPWCFMGEEIALSMRAWTSGWNIYAPRKNLISHQYRPGRMGLPKFWESVGRAFGRPGNFFSNRMQAVMIDRVKHMVGYPGITKEYLQSENHEYILNSLEYYGLGNQRTRQEYLDLTLIDFDTLKCHRMDWCNRGTME